jgi:hypothetical protein
LHRKGKKQDIKKAIHPHSGWRENKKEKQQNKNSFSFLPLSLAPEKKKNRKKTQKKENSFPSLSAPTP